MFTQFIRGVRRDVSSSALFSISAVPGSTTLSTQAGTALTDTRAGAKYARPTPPTATLVASNTPAISYPGVACEPAITNITLASNAIGGTGWAGTASGTANTATQNAAVAPDGTTTASLITMNTAFTGVNFSTYVNTSAIFTQTGVVTFSIWLMAGTLTSIPIEITCIGGATGASAIVNCTLTNQWQRFQVSTTVTANDGTTGQIWARIGADQGAFTFPTGTLYAWGAQTEVAKYAHSLVSTTTVAATTPSDFIANSALAAKMPVTSGAVNFRFTPLWDTASAPANVVLLDCRGAGGTSGACFRIQGAQLAYLVNISGAEVTYVAGTDPGWTRGVASNITIRWGAGNVNFFRDGVLLATTTGATMPTSHNGFNLGCDYTGGSILDGFLTDISGTN